MPEKKTTLKKKQTLQDFTMRRENNSNYYFIKAIKPKNGISLNKKTLKKFESVEKKAPGFYLTHSPTLKNPYRTFITHYSPDNNKVSVVAEFDKSRNNEKYVTHLFEEFGISRTGRNHFDPWRISKSIIQDKNNKISLVFRNFKKHKNKESSEIFGEGKIISPKDFIINTIQEGILTAEGKKENKPKKPIKEKEPKGTEPEDLDEDFSDVVSGSDKEEWQTNDPGIVLPPVLEKITDQIKKPEETKAIVEVKKGEIIPVDNEPKSIVPVETTALTIWKPQPLALIPKNALATIKKEGASLAVIADKLKKGEMKLINPSKENKIVPYTQKENVTDAEYRVIEDEEPGVRGELSDALKSVKGGNKEGKAKGGSSYVGGGVGIGGLDMSAILPLIILVLIVALIMSIFT